jgi:hypothetical protein
MYLTGKTEAYSGGFDAFTCIAQISIHVLIYAWLNYFYGFIIHA